MAGTDLLQITSPYEYWHGHCTTSGPYRSILFSAREDSLMNLPYEIRIGNVPLNPSQNTLFATINAGSGWYIREGPT